MNRQEVMKQLENLNTTADQALGGLTASRHLMLKIEKAAANPAPAAAKRPGWVPALACAMALVLAVAVGVPSLQQQNETLITAQSAGDGPVGNEIALNLPGDSVNVSKRSGAPAYRSLWAEGSGSFPLIGVNGRYYRMMTSPGTVSSGLLGGSIGAVAEYTTEPSLSGSDVLLSNVAPFGAEVYEISGMGGTFVAAEVDGRMRLFQRVSYNGSALRGSEDLADTLQISGRVMAMELSDVGIVTNPDTCQALLETLLDCASYESSGSVSPRQSLLIVLDNGLTVQLSVRSDNLSACGTWSCPEFFEEFEAAAE